jgi:hypothetical protein
MTPHSSKKERVCRDCFILQNQVKMPLSRDPSPAQEEESSSYPEGRNYSWSLSQSGTSEGDTEEGSTSPLDVSQEQLNDASSYCSNKTPSVILAGTTSHSNQSRLETTTDIKNPSSSNNIDHASKDSVPQSNSSINTDDQNSQPSCVLQTDVQEPEERVKFKLGSAVIPSVFTDNLPQPTSHADRTAEESNMADTDGQDRAVEGPAQNEAGSEEDPDIYARETDEYKLASASEGANPSAGFDDDVFDLITDDEIANSIHEPNPDPNMYGCPTLTFEVIGPDGLESPEDLWVLPGKVYMVPIEISSAGAELAWEFSTEYKNIHFSVIFKESDLVVNEEAEVLIPTCKCNSHKHSIQGELVARKTGIYSLLFDNSASRFTSKKLHYKLRVKLPDAVD